MTKTTAIGVIVIALLFEVRNVISLNSCEARETNFTCQRISTLVQRFMTVCRPQTAQTDDCTQFCIFFSILAADAL